MTKEERENERRHQQHWIRRVKDNDSKWSQYLQFSVKRSLGSFGAVPPYWLGQSFKQGIKKGSAPMRMKLKNQKKFFEFPIEPTVEVEAKNTFVSRKINKSGSRGTVKERWTKDDYTITIKGIFIEESKTAEMKDNDSLVFNLTRSPSIDMFGTKYKFPEANVEKLIGFLDADEPIEVRHKILEGMGIKYILFETLKFPVTEGLDVQQFEIKAVSAPDIELADDAPPAAPEAE